jgi:alkylation response protein AidB-like acyl-CoA dehydrogenase
MLNSALSEPILSALRPLCSELAELNAGQDDPKQLAAVLERSPITNLLLPTGAGGLGGSWVDLIGAATIAARASGSAAWLISHYAVNAALVGRFAESVHQEVWASPTPWVAQALRAQTPVCRSAADHVVVSGEWPVVTGAAHAQWVLLQAPGPDTGDVVLLVPRQKLEAADLDYLGGLRGVGFQHLIAREIEVPASHVISREMLFAKVPDGVAVEASSASASAEPYWLNAQLGSVLGCAEGGYEEYREITSQRVGGVAGNKVAELTQVQSRLAHTRTDLKTASLLTTDIVGRVGRDSAELLAGERSYVARLCLESLARLVHQMGARGLFDTNPLQRRYRDLRAMVAHDVFDWRRHMAGLGRLELGISSE